MYGYVIKWFGSKPKHDTWVANIYNEVGGKNICSRVFDLDNAQVFTKQNAEKRIGKILARRLTAEREDFRILPVSLKIEQEDGL
jgi:hypothetical protein